MGETTDPGRPQGDEPSAPRRAPDSGPTAAKSAAAAMDDLDAQDRASARTDDRDRADEFARYQELATVSEQQLADHVRGGRRVEDGRTQQMWNWTNADVCRCQREVLRRRFAGDVTGRELSESEGFDRAGNRIRVDGGVDTVVGAAGDRFNDVVRELDGTKIFGTGRGLERPEVQILRTRYANLVAQERWAEDHRYNSRRWAGQWALFALFIAGFVLFLVLVYSG